MFLFVVVEAFLPLPFCSSSSIEVFLSSSSYYYSVCNHKSVLVCKEKKEIRLKMFGLILKSLKPQAYHNVKSLVVNNHSRKLSSITRVGVENPNMAQLVIHNGIAYISGQVDDTGSDVKAQTANILQKVDALLEQAGTDKSKLLTASIWLKDIGTDFSDMNTTWNTWLDPDNKPVRATVEANMASPKLLVEIQVSAAIE